ncbi:MAG: HEAT repeat domain-containing protein [Planctomycetota bacterium]|jgi:hypothetical protein
MGPLRSRAFLFTLLIGLLAVTSALAGEKPAKEEEGPKFPEATEEEAVKILEELAKIPAPKHLWEVMRINVVAPADVVKGPLKKGERSTGTARNDPFKRYSLTAEERKELLDELNGLPPEDRKAFIEKTWKELQKRVAKEVASRKKDHMASEGVKPPGMSDEEFEKAYEKAKKEQAAAGAGHKSRFAEAQAFLKARAAAVQAILLFGQKATPFVAEAFEKASLDTGSVLVSVVAGIPDDTRADEAMIAWLDKRPFEGSIQGQKEKFLKVLGRLNPAGLIPALERALTRTSWHNRGAFLRGIFSARNAGTAGEVAKALLRFLNKGDTTNSEIALNFLFYLLPDANVDDDTKAQIIETISGMIWNPRFKNLALHATTALGRSKHEGAVEPLGRLLEHTNARVVLYAIRSLGSLGRMSQEHGREVTRFLDERFPLPFRSEAAKALGYIRSGESVLYLIDVLYEPDLPIDFRTTVQKSLGRICGVELGSAPERWANWWENSRPEWEEKELEKEQAEKERKAREGK